MTNLLANKSPGLRRQLLTTTVPKCWENVVPKETIEGYVEREVKPYVPDAWVDEDYTPTGYEIPFTQFFYKFEPPRPLNAIEAEIGALEAEIQGILREVVG